jgi:endonuclease/exonuclease/phosphatase family metal-dependent hydrolase
VANEGPYGPLITTTLRVLTWNAWGRFGPWQAREAALLGTLKQIAPDIIALQESWCDRDGANQAARFADALGYHHVYGGGNFLENDWGTGAALLSHWPLERHEYREFPASKPEGWGGAALFASVNGPRGSIPVFSVALDWPPYASALRQASVRHLAAFVHEVAGRSFPALVCGDFNAPPDSDEIRLLTGRSETVAPKFVLFDAWEMAGEGDGHTWTRNNPWAAPTLLPDKRIDYIFTGWPRPDGGAGHVVRCSIEGVDAVNGVVPSDHYAVCVDLRY